MQRGDGRLELIRADRSAREGEGDQRDALVDLGAVPQGAVLFVEADQFARRVGAGGTARVGQQHEGEQPRDLAVAGQQRPHGPGQPDRLGARSARCNWGPDVAVYPSLKIR